MIIEVPLASMFFSSATWDNGKSIRLMTLVLAVRVRPLQVFWVSIEFLVVIQFLRTIISCKDSFEVHGYGLVQYNSYLSVGMYYIYRSGHTRLETSSSIPNLEIKQSRAVSVLG